MGRAEDLFERIKCGGISAIEALISDRASEELFLEFKRSADDGQGNKLHERDLGNLRKAVSGFANSEGGVLIWGVDCSREASVGDVASFKKPLVNPTRYVSWLEGAISGCTVPPVMGVRSVSIQIDDETGFAVTYIPQSTHAPHQVVGDGKYVIRAGSNFVPAPHGVIAGLFGRPPHPVVFPNFILKPIDFTFDGYVQASANVVIVNNGQVVAEDVFLSLHTPDAPKEKQGVGLDANTKWTMTSALGFDRSWICPREFRLAPGGMVDIVTIRLILGRKSVADFRCKLTVGCRGGVPSTAELFTSRQDLDLELEQCFRAKKDSDTNCDLHKAASILLGLDKLPRPY